MSSLGARPMIHPTAIVDPAAELDSGVGKARFLMRLGSPRLTEQL